MNQAMPASRCVKAAFALILASSLATGLVPVSAFADTSVKVTTAAPAQVSETVNLAGVQASGEGQPEGEATAEGTQSPAKNTNQAASGQVKTSNQSASAQATASVALAADTTTVLDNGLVFVIENATNKAAVTGWYGAQPAENLIVPAEIRHNGKLSVVNILGGGGGSLHVLGSEDSSTSNLASPQTPASAQTLALQKIQKNAPKPSATGQEGTLVQLPNLTSVTIPETITAITTDTFTDCPQLATISVAASNPTYASVDGVLYNKALTRALLFPESAEGVVSLPDQTDAVPASALSHCANLHTLLVGQDNVAYTSINGSLYSKDATTLVACPGGIGETLTLPKQTSTIGPDALAGITTLKSIVVLGNIATIDPTAFNDQAKQSTTIALPGGEDYEARKAVWQSAGFKNFATPANPGDTQTPDQPGEGTQPGQPGDKPTDPSKPASGFTYKLLEDYTLEASWTGDLTPTSTPSIPATAQLAGLSYTVSALAPKAFAGTALTTLDIPTTITTIGDQAFANCPKLTRIVTHTNTIQVAPTALEACTNLEVWCPYNEAETYPWSIGLFATNNHIKAYGLPASPQALTLEVGQSANLFEPGTLQAPDPSKAVYAYEATCLSVSQEGTITAKAPGTTTITTSIELEEIPLTHTTRTISVVAPTPPTTPDQPETPTPTPPNAQPITPRYPPNLATPTQASAPLYSRGGIQPRAYVPTVSVTVPTTTIITIDAAGNQKANTLDIKSNTAEPIRVKSIKCTELTGATKLLPNLDTVDPDVDSKGRAKTKVTVKEPASNQLEFALSKTPPALWEAPKDASTPFRIEANLTIPITFGLTIPDNATFSYLPKEEAEFAQVEFTFDRLAPMATGLNLTSSTGTLTDSKVGDTLTAAYTGLTPGVSATYTWFALAPDATPTSENAIKGANSSSFQLTANEIDKYVCCAVSDGAFTTPANWKYRPVYSDLTAQVAAGGPPQPALPYNTLQEYSWAALSDIADYLSWLDGKQEETTDIVYTTFKRFMDNDLQKSISTTPGDCMANMPKVRIVGINHDAVEVDALGNPTKTAGLTFMATHSLPKAYQMHSSGYNTGGWKGSELYPKMQTGGEIWNTLPDDLKATGIIKPVRKLTNNVKGEAAANTEPTETFDYLWLPSYKELVGNTSSLGGIDHWINKEGSQYEFFTTKKLNADGTYDIFKGMDKTQDGVHGPSGANYTYWWERSCYPGSPRSFVNCNTGGNPSDGDNANSAYGVVLGFSL